MSAFDDCFKALLGEEGVLSTDRNDRGNWTGGDVGKGTFVGSKYGISAAAYPTLDIVNLTVEQAKVIAKRDYWDRVRGDELPPHFAGALFDMAYNQGAATAIKIFQKALGVGQDGVFGDGTMAAFRGSDHTALARTFTIYRIIRYSMCPGWVNDANGWVGRAIDCYAEMVKP